MMNSFVIITGTDFVQFRTEIGLNINNSRECVAVIILEDQQLEASESFFIVVEELGVMTEVIILDDDGKNH